MQNLNRIGAQPSPQDYTQDYMQTYAQTPQDQMQPPQNYAKYSQPTQPLAQPIQDANSFAQPIPIAQSVTQDSNPYAQQAQPTQQPQLVPTTQPAQFVQAVQPTQPSQFVQPVQQSQPIQTVQTTQVIQPTNQLVQQAPPKQPAANEVVLHAGEYTFGQNFPEGTFDIRLISGEGMISLFDGDNLKAFQSLGGENGAVGWAGMPSNELSHFLLEGNLMVGVSRAFKFTL